MFHKILSTCLQEFLIVKDNNINPTQSNLNTLLHELRRQEDELYYRNVDQFDCITCMETIAKDEGILFSNCLHPFCKQCLMRLAETNSDPTVPCPHDGCTAFVTERELRGVRMRNS